MDPIVCMLVLLASMVSWDRKFGTTATTEDKVTCFFMFIREEWWVHKWKSKHYLSMQSIATCVYPTVFFSVIRIYVSGSNKSINLWYGNKRARVIFLIRIAPLIVEVKPILFSDFYLWSAVVYISYITLIPLNPIGHWSINKFINKKNIESHPTYSTVKPNAHYNSTKKPVSAKIYIRGVHVWQIFWHECTEKILTLDLDPTSLPLVIVELPSHSSSLPLFPTFGLFFLFSVWRRYIDLTCDRWKME